MLIDRYTYIVLFNFVIFACFYINASAYVNNAYKEEESHIRFLTSFFTALVMWFPIFVFTSIVFALMW